MNQEAPGRTKFSKARVEGKKQIYPNGYQNITLCQHSGYDHQKAQYPQLLPIPVNSAANGGKTGLMYCLFAAQTGHGTIRLEKFGRGAIAMTSHAGMAFVQELARRCAAAYLQSEAQARRRNSLAAVRSLNYQGAVLLDPRRSNDLTGIQSGWYTEKMRM
ncbi:MAG: hypothetical protein F8N36_12475 [Desulfovibrio sp.]|uniref:hypothetical protein n=1 Tax=Desulfovibrio sp. TaxID=885 RepID=UPI00135EB71A|nr:hypothetical protein [Desulfovibrio sp.]MTJ93661.1 hypothetical protein [Desulfovibrio sp.]